MRKLLLALVCFGWASVAFAQTPTPATSLYYNDARGNPSSQGSPGDITVPFSYTVPATYFGGTGAVLKLATIPKGATVTDFMVDFPDLDDTASIVIDIGDATTSGKFSTGQTTIPRVAGVIKCPVAGTAAACVLQSLPTSAYTAASDFRITATTGTAANPAVSTTIKGWLRYHIRTY